MAAEGGRTLLKAGFAAFDMQPPGRSPLSALEIPGLVN